ncbi:MAG TPA: SMP-30/gluconolactonase/LRE family protein [Puia sp.]|nr:SMP-30/gluconolactonase/LRE family protein [Puia sp.]
MKYKHLSSIVIFMIILAACNDHSSGTEKKDSVASTPAVVSESPRHVSILDAEGLNLIDSNTAIEVIANGYKWTEGPVYVTDSDYLLFSDVPANRIYKWKQGTGASLYLEPSGYTGTVPKEKEPGSNGLVIDKAGRLVLCQQGNRQIGRMKSSLNDPKPVFETIVSTYQGKKFNSPNDAVYAANGNLYFTDPPYGLEKGIKDSSKEIKFQGIFLVKAGRNKAILFSDKVSYPNGIALSPDNKILYISNSDGDNKEWTKYELNDQGLISKGSVFYHVSAEEGKLPGSPDGMKVNAKGYIFASGPGGIWLFNPAGKVLARIYTGELTSNCFIDQVHNMLYMTCNSYVMRIKLKS